MKNPTGYVLLTDENYINELLAAFKTDDDFTVQKLTEYFSPVMKKGKNTNEFSFDGIELPRYFTSDEFVLKEGALPNVKEDTLTSVGVYLFNVFAISNVFGNRIPYYNPKDGLTPDNIEKLQQMIIDAILSQNASGEEFAKFQTKAVWLGYRGSLWNAGQSYEFAKVNPKVSAAKPKILAEWRKAVEEGADPVSSYAIMVEKKLLAIAKEDLKKSDAWPIYARGGKPKFGNVYKNCTISMGPVFDPVTGTYKIASNSFMDGIEKEYIPTFANIQVDAAYNRGVATQDGGAKTKLIFAALQSVTLNPEKLHDCGSRKYVLKTITKKNLSKNLLRFIVDPETKKLVKLTQENFPKFEGKTVKMRSPLYCKDPEYCNICAGDYFYELGLTNIGNSAIRISSTLMNKALKAMHDISVKADYVDPLKYMTIV